MSRQFERTQKAPTKGTDIMRTLIATVVTVVSATLLINFTNQTPTTIKYSMEQSLTETAVAAPVEVVTPPVVQNESAQAPAQTAQPVAAPAKPTQTAPASTCASEISKYSSWNQNVAQAVMMAESSGNAATLNDNPTTGDYSIGCFQINLINANLNDKYRVALTLGYTDGLGREQLTAWLKDPAHNVAMADALYVRAGNWGDWKYTCQTKVQCY